MAAKKKSPAMTAERRRNLSKAQLEQVVAKADKTLGGGKEAKAARASAGEIAKAAAKRKGSTPKVKAGGTAQKPNPAIAAKKTAKRK